MKKIFFSGIALLAIGLSAGIVTNAQRVGGYKEIPSDDPRAAAAAEFAVTKRAEEQEGLTLDAIEKAESQVVAGTNFRLCMTVSLGEEKQQVKAVIYQNLKAEYSLTSWDVVETCGEAKTESAGSRRAIPKLASCTGDQLSLVEGDGDADMGGKRYGDFIFTNTSSQSCSMSGYPVFAVLNRAGKIMSSVPVTYSNDYPNSEVDKSGHRKAVTLEPGKMAKFQIYYNDGMALDHKKPFPTVARVRISAPNDKKVFLIKTEFTACCGIQVGSIQAFMPLPD